MRVIGITGGSGAGKSSALRALKRLGALALDADEIYHKMLSESNELKAELEARFLGVLSGGKIDRRKLGEIVFSNPKELSDLNAITHKYVSGEIDRRINEWHEQGGTVAAIDAIALIESGRNLSCDVVVGITAPKGLRIQRIIKRDGITHEQAELRINAQKPDSFYKEHCDHIISGTSKNQEEFEETNKELFKKLVE